MLSDSRCLSQPQCLSADRLFDDCCGIRKRLECGGIVLETDLTQFYQGVASGGVNETFNYAGHGDYAVTFDFGKLANMHGFSLLARGEHRYGEFLASDAGLISPANLWAAAPTIETTDMVLTNFILTQVINDHDAATTDGVHCLASRIRRRVSLLPKKIPANLIRVSLFMKPENLRVSCGGVRTEAAKPVFFVR